MAGRRLPGPFDLVLDCTGATTFAQCRHLLAPAGVYANTLPNGAMYRDAVWAALTSRQRVIPVMERPVREDLEHAEVPELERELEAGRGRGEFVVRLA